ncbi:2934_t:CDS:1, partial [Gigaspora margarita]
INDLKTETTEKKIEILLQTLLQEKNSSEKQNVTRNKETIPENSQAIYIEVPIENQDKK